MQGQQLVTALSFRLSSIARSLIQFVGRRIAPEHRARLAVQLARIGAHMDIDSCLQILEKALSEQKLDASQLGRLLSAAFSAADADHLPLDLRKQLLTRACAGLDPADIPDALLEHFSALGGSSHHYSQEGEDILLKRLFGDRRSGFYVDIGAHHATRFSNTFALYRRGWRGINVDATPGSMSSFGLLRPRDVNLELAVSDQTDPLRMHLFREGALNTTNAELADSYVAAGWDKTGEIELRPKTLASIMDEFVPPGINVDLLSVDVEGAELAVLRSGNWDVYAPAVIIIEALSTPFAEMHQDPALRYLLARNYEVRFRLFNSVILARAGADFS
ncbi:SAM-dependent methyltransferase [Bradyrhizobium oligotrophicum S58]|uniref:SAM-dependent methyltransferase n=1 Tax=Bradyrhizobium oligotrophicum S58 TaxID=1245469 RepID=M4Z1M8_9BRAD|nr:FkbM family methyltransferase [Bradyrhizobium oligotrophicum]BAM86874.1 SAM-dependent methyltransferase [Bradyrhizobium oligotrophicum S58]